MDAVFSLADQLSVLVRGHVLDTDDVVTIRNNPEVQRAILEIPMLRSTRSARTMARFKPCSG